MEGPPPEMGLEVTPKGLRFDESWDESWTDRPAVPKSSPRLARSLRSTGVLWESLAPKTVADFAMENCNPVPSDVQRQRLYAHERLRQKNLQLVLDARRKLLAEGLRPVGAASAPPQLEGPGDEDAALTPMEMAKQKAEAAMALREMKRQANKEAGEKRLAEMQQQLVVQAELAEAAAKKQDEITVQFEAKKKAQARAIIEKRQAAMEFRLKREKQKEVEMQAEFEFARKAEAARKVKDELITQKRVATQKAMREKGAAFKLKHKEKLARIARAAALAEENSDVMALEKEKIVEEKHRRLAARVKKQQKMMKVVNAAKAAEQLQRRTGLFRKAEEALEEQRAATLKHLEEVDHRLQAKQAKTLERIERQKQEAVEREMGRAAALEEKEQSLLEASMVLEDKRKVKETFMAGVNKVREAERQKAKESRKLARAVRVDAVHRLRRAKEFEAVVQKEEFEVKNLKSDTLLETKQRLVDQQRNSAIDFSVHSQRVRKKHATGFKALHGPTAVIPDYGLWNQTTPMGPGAARPMGIGGSLGDFSTGSPFDA